jgi:hypothetical protein
LGEGPEFLLLSQDAQKHSGPVYVDAGITGKINEPKIKFDINFPIGSPMNDGQSQAALKQILTEARMPQQATWLIVFGSFAPITSNSGVVRNSVVGLGTNVINTISNQLLGTLNTILTNSFRQFFNAPNLNFDLSNTFYSSNASLLTGGSGGLTSGTFDRQIVGVRISQGFFNNKIILRVGSDFDFSINGAAVNVNQLENFNFLPDINLEFILSANRKLRAIVFTRKSVDIGGTRNRWGASLSYRTEFDPKRKDTIAKSIF